MSCRLITCNVPRAAGLIIALNISLFGYAHISPMLSIAQQMPVIRSGKASLEFPMPEPGKYGVRLPWKSLKVSNNTSSTGNFHQQAPLAIEVIDDAGVAKWLNGAYTRVVATKYKVVCQGNVTSENGTHFIFTDIYRTDSKIENAFTLKRTVQITSASPKDTAFSSRFSLAWGIPTTTHDCDFFVPGIWYKDNAHVPPTALASHLDDRHLFFREDRLPLPVIMARDLRTGITLSINHIGGNPTTFAGEDGLNRIVDERMQFGSLGFVNTGNLEASFLFPGTEGERTYTHGGSKAGNRWSYRSHPVRNGFSQNYTLVICVNSAADYPTAVAHTWKTAYRLAEPPFIRADMDRVYGASMDLLATYCHEYNGVISMPFQVRVPDGEPKDISSEMGFVGQALPSAALLLGYGLEKKDQTIIGHASSLIDFWVNNSMTPSGIPKQWYDIHPDGTVTWRNFATPLRVGSDGMDGALQAWNVLRKHGQNKAEWLAFCRKYGDWLVKVQNPDGSYFSTYKVEGEPSTIATNATDHPIKFLVDLYMATRDATYRDAALRAGKFCWSSVHQTYAYVGGTPDNPNVMDKEAGMIAVDAFLALYDVTGDKLWVTAASQAATFSETWVYCWNIPMPPDDPKQIFPRNRTTYGLSLIATGHSGADAYMAIAPFNFYRLYLLTGDWHFRDSAQMLMHNTKQMMDWDGSLGYKYPGLLTEVLSLPPLRGHGVQGWLPWLTVAILDPMVRLKETFGQMDIDSIERLPKAERMRRHTEFSKQRGFMIPHWVVVSSAFTQW